VVQITKSEFCGPTEAGIQPGGIKLFNVMAVMARQSAIALNARL